MATINLKLSQDELALFNAFAASKKTTIVEENYNRKII